MCGKLLEPMKKPVVKILRTHKDLLTNYFKAGKVYFRGIVESLNCESICLMRKDYGDRSYELLQT